LNRKPPINNQIKAREVRVIDEAGKQLGIMDLESAVKIARERNLDLIQVTEKVTPPICKVMDFGRYLYQQQKKEKKQRPKGGEIKGIRLTFSISLHDLETRAHQAEKFLKEGDKIRIEMVLRGREKALGNFAKEKINKFLEILQGLVSYKIERELKRGPRGFTLIVGKQ
jgi:translation initiation factor IF-3